MQAELAKNFNYFRTKIDECVSPAEATPKKKKPE
jgi:hypothetical protein